MHTLIAPQRSEHRQSELSPLASPRLHDRTPKTSLPDRLALRVALALLLWSTRPTRGYSAAQLHLERSRLDREDRWLRQRLQLPLS